MSWLDRLFGGGYSRVQIAGVDLPGEVAINFVSGATGADDPGNDRTNVTVVGASNAQTEWTAFTPVFTASDGGQTLPGSGGAVSGYWRQNGPDSIDVTAEILLGSTANMGAGDLLMEIPNAGSLAIDTSKVPNANNGFLAGFADAFDDGTSAYFSLRMQQSVDLDHFRFISMIDNAIVDATAPFVWSTDSSLSLFVTIPVTGL